MSEADLYGRMPLWILKDHVGQLSKAALTLLNALTRYADFQSRSAWPTQRRLRADYGLAFSSISKGLAELAQRGLIQISQASRRGANLYRLAADPAQAEIWAAEYQPKSKSKKAGFSLPPPEPILPGLLLTTPAEAAAEKSPSAPENGALNREPNLTACPQNTRALQKMERSSAPETGALRGGKEGGEIDNHNIIYLNLKSKTDARNEYLFKKIFNSDYLSANAFEAAHQYLLAVGIRGAIPQDILNQYEPEDIIQACKNGIARYARMCRAAGQKISPHSEITENPGFNLAGYVIASLIQAHREDHSVRPSRLFRKLERENTMTPDEQLTAEAAEKRQHEKLVRRQAVFLKR